MQVKTSALCVYTAAVIGLTTIATQLYYAAQNTPDPADDIANGRSWAGKCIKTDSKEDVYQLQCSALSIRVNARDYDRAVRAWELTGERRASDNMSEKG